MTSSCPKTTEKVVLQTKEIGRSSKSVKPGNKFLRVDLVEPRCVAPVEPTRWPFESAAHVEPKRVSFEFESAAHVEPKKLNSIGGS